MDNNSKDIIIKSFSRVPRQIYINDTISTDSLAQFKKDLFEIESNDISTLTENYNALCLIDKKIADAYKNAIKFSPIVINICSPGGELYAGLGMYDLIKAYDENPKYDITVVVDGYAASMATIIMLGCKKRISSKNSSFLVHSASSFVFGKINDVTDDVDELKRVDKICKEIYMSSTKLTEEKLQEIDKYRKDWWMSADEALKYKIITEIK
jgi:ATP-dependent protease ClpP protease subunit